jgi:hypothetical protein
MNLFESNSAFIDQESGETVYEFIPEVTVKEPKKKLLKPLVVEKTTKRVPKKKAKTTDRAIFGRMKKILEDYPREIEGLAPLRKKYKAIYKEDLAMPREVKNRLLSRYNNIYENLIFIKNQKEKL